MEVREVIYYFLIEPIVRILHQCFDHIFLGFLVATGTDPKELFQQRWYPWLRVSVHDNPVKRRMIRKEFRLQNFTMDFSRRPT